MIYYYLSLRQGQTSNTNSEKTSKKVLTKKNSFDKIKKLKQVSKNFEN